MLIRPSNKHMRWTELQSTLLGVTDALGMTIDTDIFPLVLALNACDFPTSGSCAGHLDEESTPYVDLMIPVSDQERQQAHQALQEAQKQELFQQLPEHEIRALRQKANDLYEQVNYPAALIHQRLTNYLNQFYMQHHVPYDQQISLLCKSTFGVISIIRLEPQSVQHFRLLSTQERSNKLQAYQSEFYQFGTFLERCYWNDTASTKKEVEG